MGRQQACRGPSVGGGRTHPEAASGPNLPSIWQQAQTPIAVCLDLDLEPDTLVKAYPALRDEILAFVR